MHRNFRDIANSFDFPPVQIWIPIIFIICGCVEKGKKSIYARDMLLNAKNTIFFPSWCPLALLWSIEGVCLKSSDNCWLFLVLFNFFFILRDNKRNLTEAHNVNRTTVLQSVFIRLSQSDWVKVVFFFTPENWIHVNLLQSQ